MDSASSQTCLAAMAPTSQVATFTMLSGDRSGTMFVLDEGSLDFGRGETADVRVDDPLVSRRHARVERTGGVAYLEDLASTNGTYVNGRPIRRHLLADGDRIGLGSNAIFAYRLQDQIEQEATRKMLDDAIRDPMTRAFNRRYFESALVAALDASNRDGLLVALVMIDVDHFKTINDRYGHVVGDEALRRIVDTISHAVRGDDLVARYGGEELCVLARGAGRTEAAMLAERIRRAVESEDIVAEGSRIGTTVSLGIATAPRDHGPIDPTAFVREADSALYRAKAAGRNRCEFA